MTRRSLLRAALLPVALTLGLLPKAKAAAKPRRAQPGNLFNLTLHDGRPELLAKFDLSQFSGPGDRLSFAGAAGGFVQMLEDGHFEAYTSDGRQLRVKRCNDKVCVLP